MATLLFICFYKSQPTKRAADKSQRARLKVKKVSGSFRSRKPLGRISMLLIQRKRTPGWRMPPNSVYIGRPTIHGNDHRIGEYNPQTGLPMTAQEAVDAFERDIRTTLALAGKKRFVDFYIKPLLEKNLVCWCAPTSPCHGAIWLKLIQELSNH